MNYIELIIQFWQTRRRVRLTSAEADLYFCLLQECNLRDWANPFECPNGLICALINIDEKTLLRARNGLQQKGFITFEKGLRKAKSPVYRLLYPQNSRKNGGIIGGIAGGKKGNIPLKQNQTENKPSVSPPAGDGELPLGIVEDDLQKKRALICERVQKAYHQHCKGLPPIRTMTPNRQQAVMARIKEHGEAAVLEMLQTAGRSSFLAGQNGRQWTATFDWLFKPKNFLKTLEHNYDDKTKQYDEGRTVVGRDQRKCFTGQYSETF